MAQALKCSHCGAPLPDSQARTVTCRFCGTTNRLGPTVGQTQVREAVRQLLEERAQPPPRPEKPNVAPFVIAGAVVLMMVAGVLASVLLSAPAPTPPPRRAIAVPPTPPIPAPPPPKPEPVEPKLEPWGALSAIAFDEHGDLLVVLGQALVKIDLETFSAAWRTPFTRGSGNYSIVIPRGEHVAVVTDSKAVFFDARSGELTDDFKYRTGGILERACAAGATQVLVDVLGAGVMRFDAATGKKATSGPGCALKDKFACLPGQRCGWDRMENADYDCRHSVRVGKDVFRSCETEDGKKRKVIISTAPKKWEAETGDTAETFFGVVDDVVVVGAYRSVFALDRATGEKRWSVPGERSQVVVKGSKLYLGTGGTLVELDVKTGEALRRLPLRG